MSRRAPTLALAVWFVSACAGSNRPPPTPRPKDLGAETHATVAGHRCDASTHCTCRTEGAEDQAEQTPPEGDLRRFEVRVSSSTGQVWVTVDKTQTLYKSGERAEDCYYIDLEPGGHTFSLYAKAEEPMAGVGAGLHVSEYEPSPSPSWYDAFVFQCGVPGACDRDVLGEWKKDVQGDRRSLRDYCGATHVTDLKWEVGRAPDALHPEDLLLDFTLGISPHRPTKPPRDPSCPAI